MLTHTIPELPQAAPSDIESRTLSIRLVYRTSRISLALRLSSRNITRKAVTVLALWGASRTVLPSLFGDFMSLIHRFIT